MNLESVQYVFFFTYVSSSMCLLHLSTIMSDYGVLLVDFKYTLFQLCIFNIFFIFELYHRTTKDITE
jgi:hypothetical protein